MGYIYLLLALTFGIIKAYCGKRSSSAAACSYDAIVINTVRMVCCIAISVILVVVTAGPKELLCSAKMLPIALLSGVGTACFTVSWLLAVGTMAYMMVEVFVMAGTVVPLMLCSVLYGEEIRGVQILGMLLLLVAVYCMCTYKNKDKIGFTVKSVLLLLSVALSSGLSDFSQKLYTKEIADGNISVFNLYTYLFAAAVLLVASFAFRAKEKKENLRTPFATVKPILPYVLVMAACLFLNAYFKTAAAKILDAVLLYPLNQGCAVVLSLGMSVVIFREKINAKGILGILLSIAAMILINSIGS